MTDEQWTWLYANMQVDDDEMVEHMCPKCVADAKGNKCIKCGVSLDDVEETVNSNFDSRRFEKLKKES